MNLQGKISVYKQILSDEDSGDESNAGQSSYSIPGRSNSASHGQTFDKKSKLPPAFYKAKRTVNAVINDFWLSVRKQLSAKQGFQLRYNERLIDQLWLLLKRTLTFVKSGQNPPWTYIERTPINVEPGRRLVDPTVKEATKSSTARRQINRSKTGPVFSKAGCMTYLSESQKLIILNQDGTVVPVSIEATDCELPQIASPAFLKNFVYLLDGAYLDPITTVFQPTELDIKIVEKADQMDTLGRAKGANVITASASKLNASANYVRRPRFKCAVVNDGSFLYQIGGYSTFNRFTSRECQRYDPDKNCFSLLAALKGLHTTPSACVLGSTIWVFSNSAPPQCYCNGDWRQLSFSDVAKEMFPFQFVEPISTTAIAIFGGISPLGQHSKLLRIYHTDSDLIEQMGEVLPNGVCSERVHGVAFINKFLGIMSTVEGSILPKRSSMQNWAMLSYVGYRTAYTTGVLLPE